MTDDLQSWAACCDPRGTGHFTITKMDSRMPEETFDSLQSEIQKQLSQPIGYEGRSYNDAVKDFDELLKTAERYLINHNEQQRLLEQSWQDGHNVQEMRHRDELNHLKGLIRNVIAGNWCVTTLQESIGDL